METNSWRNRRINSDQNKQLAGGAETEAKEIPLGQCKMKPIS